MAEPIWYYAIDDQEHGPVTAAALKELAGRGELRPHDLVWKAGLNDWTAAKNVAGLFPAGAKASAAAGKGSQQQDSQADTSDDLLYHRGKPAAHEPAATSEPPVDAQLAAPQEPVFEPEPETSPPPAEDAYYNEPPAPPPIAPHVPTGVPVTGEYRPQERLRKTGVTAGPVTLGVARWTVIGSLLLLVCLQGCESLGARYVSSLQAIRSSAEEDFRAQWESKRAALKSQRNALQAQTNKSAAEATELGRILDDLQSLDSDMAAARAQVEDTDWLALEIAAQQAQANHVQRLWWLALFKLPLAVLLTSGSLVLALFSDGQERWLGLGLVILMAAAVLLISH